MKIIHSTWFSSFAYLGVLGIIIVEDDEGKRKAFVGMGFGLNEESDTQKIIRDGTNLPRELIDHIFNLLKEGKSA